MGCDIHMYVEYKNKESNHWWNFGKRINPGRIYGMFAKLANVRNYTNESVALFELRGIPEDISSETFSDYALYISDTDKDNYIPTERAKKWVDEGSSVYLRDGKFISAPDWHSHSWCTADELDACIKDVWSEGLNGCEIEYIAMVDLMKSFERQGKDVRVVFWFDN